MRRKQIKFLLVLCVTFLCIQPAGISASANNYQSSDGFPDAAPSGSTAPSGIDGSLDGKQAALDEKINSGGSCSRPQIVTGSVSMDNSAAGATGSSGSNIVKNDNQSSTNTAEGTVSGSSTTKIPGSSHTTGGGSSSTTGGSIDKTPGTSHTTETKKPGSSSSGSSTTTTTGGSTTTSGGGSSNTSGGNASSGGTGKGDFLPGDWSTPDFTQDMLHMNSMYQELKDATGQTTVTEASNNKKENEGSKENSNNKDSGKGDGSNPEKSNGNQNNGSTGNNGESSTNKPWNDVTVNIDGDTIIYHTPDGDKTYDIIHTTDFEDGTITDNRFQVDLEDGTHVEIELEKDEEGNWVSKNKSVSHTDKGTRVKGSESEWSLINKQLEYGYWDWMNMTNEDWISHYGNQYYPISGKAATSKTVGKTSIAWTLGHGAYDNGTWSVRMTPFYTETYERSYEVKFKHTEVSEDEDGTRHRSSYYTYETRYETTKKYHVRYASTYYTVTVPLICDECEEIIICLGDDPNCDCGGINTKCDDSNDSELEIDLHTKLEK